MNINKFILESSHVSFNSVAFSLLKTLLDRLEAKNVNTIVYLCRDSVMTELASKGYTNIRLVKTTALETLLRYFRKRKSVLYFMNIPPFRLNEQSVLYFHNELILEKKSFGFRSLKFRIYRFLLKRFSKNVDFIACQTVNIQSMLEKLTGERVKKLPFYGELSRQAYNTSKAYDFCYIASEAPHKNHDRLLTAIDELSGQFTFKVLLTLPISNNSKALLERVSGINTKYGRTVIINKGNLTFEKVLKTYNQSKALIFPSLKESLGLPLIEAVSSGLLVLSSDLPYSHEVLENPLVFDPERIEDIIREMSKFLEGEYSNVNQRVIVENKLEEIINSIVYA